MVDFRGFSAAFNSTYRSLSEDFNDRERLKLAQNADSRAAAGEGRAAKAAADAAAATAAEFGGGPSLAEKAAPTGGSGGRSRSMAIPSKLGGPDDGLPVPQTPEGTPDPAYAETDPAANEEMETEAAVDRGIDVAPPAKLGVGDRAKYGDNPAPRRSALPTGGDIPPALLEAARNGNTAAAARVRALRAAAQEQGNKDRDFNERSRVNDSNIDLQKTTIDENRFALMEKNLKFLNNGITAKLQDLDGIEDTMSVNDPSISGKVKSLVTDFEKFHKETLDGKYVKVTPTKEGYQVTEYDEETDEETGGQVVKSIGELRNFGRMTGVMAQGENLGQYTAGVLGDRMSKTIAKSKAISEEAKLEANQSIGKFLDRKALANPETRKQLEADALRLGAVIGDDAYDVVEKVETDPDTGKQTKVRVRENKFIKMMQLSAPATTVQTAKGPATAEQFIQETVLFDPQAAIAEAGGIENLPMSVAEQMVKRGWPKETAEVYGQLAAQQAQQRVAQGLKPALQPNSTSNTVPQQGRGLPAAGSANPRQRPMIDPKTGQPLRTARGQPVYN